MKNFLIAFAASVGFLAAAGTALAQGSGCTRLQSASSQSQPVPPADQSGSDAQRNAG
ncbi:hypothetical protein SAMN02927900_01900 [Rhizobium mongolense subsp. loessense]|uniref:Uncharacterized protein n=1 Tax=Rhizobium mongolense subsp. loessense TaxID=158890 RepID=A0A1G4QV42_9HYPH|nr:hypothetical protein [Rhizobium mongolense]SCW48513.1 hypothetical protein SAMN02927900_01900 [Rhizobium mongolense subsp. loessense]